MEEFPRIQTGMVDVQRVAEIAGQLSIFTAPVLILFNDGKEIIREARFVHTDDLRMKIRKVYEGYYS